VDFFTHLPDALRYSQYQHGLPSLRKILAMS
jgi:hypothetical protein